MCVCVCVCVFRIYTDDWESNKHVYMKLPLWKNEYAMYESIPYMNTQSTI